MKRNIRNGILAAWLLLILPIQALASEWLVPVGKVIGLQLKTQTMTVVAYDEVLGATAQAAGLKIGDELIKIGDTTITEPEQISAALTGSKVTLTVRRGGKLQTLTLTPAQTDAGPKLGVYLRQGITGIGTVTFYDPETGLFGTLGHGVCDGKGNLLAMTKGSAYEAAVLAIQKGKSGDPGQLKGSATQEIPAGELWRNTPQGVFGTTPSGWPGQPMETATYEQTHTGTATIRSTVAGDSPKDYSVEILKIYPKTKEDGRNFLLRVTDPELLERTGGIVQGMSGSPIIQDGKLIGAVTHVLVNSPDTGYGIFIGNMLDAAG